MFVIEKKRLFVLVSAILVAISLILITVYGLKLSIEFTGGSIIEAEYEAGERPDKETFTRNLDTIGIKQYVLQPVEDNRYALRTEFLEPDKIEEIRLSVSAGGGEVIRESAIGPSVGRELRSKSIAAIIIVVIGIISFVAFAFRHVSKPVQSWKYGAVAIIALIHDIIIPTGAFALLGSILGYQVDLLFVMGILVILGYSVNDTIVVFDRIRENLLLEQQRIATGTGVKKSFSELVGLSLDQTFARSLNTSLTTLLVLVCLFVFGGESTNHFALMLIVGIISGAYSSIFLASPLLVYIAGDKQITLDEANEKNSNKQSSKNLANNQKVDPGLL